MDSLLDFELVKKDERGPVMTTPTTTPPLNASALLESAKGFQLHLQTVSKGKSEHFTCNEERECVGCVQVFRYPRFIPFLLKQHRV